MCQVMGGHSYKTVPWFMLCVYFCCTTQITDGTQQESPNVSGTLSCDVTGTVISVLDSLLTFSATIKANNSNSYKYKYHWEHNVTDAPVNNVTNYSNDTTDVLSMTFPSDVVKAGNYTMTVKMTPQSTGDQDGPVSCTESLNFKLSDFINLNMIVDQPPGRVPLKDGMYITHKNISSNIKIKDNFPNLDSVTYGYTWLLNDVTIGSTSTGKYVFMVNETRTFNFTMKLNATVMTNETTGEVVYKLGQSSTNLTLRDAVSHVNYSGPSSLQLGKSLLGSVSCQGSGPYNICISMTHHSEQVLSYCKELEPLAPCFHRLSVDDFNATGIYSLNVTVFNEVSKADAVFYVDIKVPAVNAAVPVFCVIIAILALAMILFSYRFDREHSVVETADFSFHNSRSRSNSFSGSMGGYFYLMRLKIIAFFGRAQESVISLYERAKGQPDQASYDSDDDMPSNTDRRERYGSLSEVPA